MYLGRRSTSLVPEVLSFSSATKTFSRTVSRQIHYDGRQRLSSFWMPTVVSSKKLPTAPISDPVTAAGQEEYPDQDANSLLFRAGFLRQAYSGIFHFLPLGLRVQEKLERLIDRHMRSIGASKVSLSSISSQSLWEQSGRLKKGSELFKFSDRRDSPFLLSPTHEEEITQLVAKELKSYRDVPLRLYQITRKYRDERRPRQGLLRGREFLMKDLYTFDANEAQAKDTYEQVRAAYSRIFSDLKIPFLVANADSGDMGGDLNHEYHFPNENGEDEIISCTHCHQVRNAEVVNIPSTLRVLRNDPLPARNGASEDPASMPNHIYHWRGVTQDELGSVDAFVPADYQPDPFAIKGAVPDLDLSGASNWLPENERSQQESDRTGNHADDSQTREPTSISRPYRLVIFDYRISQTSRATIINSLRKHADAIDIFEVEPASTDENKLSLIKPRNGDTCPSCHQGKLKVQQAIEVGHTFHLGTRYSEPLNATIAIQSSTPHDQALVPVEMGCHGIGISRLISAVASVLVDKTGLNWPRMMAPFEVVVIPRKGLEEQSLEIYDLLRESSLRTVGGKQENEEAYAVAAHHDQLGLDVVLDDRPRKDILWKLNDADLVGFPVMVILGKAFENGEVEVQCRRLGVKKNVEIAGLLGFVESLLNQL